MFNYDVIIHTYFTLMADSCTVTASQSRSTYSILVLI